MSEKTRMSPFSALSFSIAFVLIAGIAMVTVIGVYGIHSFNQGVDGALTLTSNTLKTLPEFIESLPPAIRDNLHDHRAPEYRDSIEVKANLVSSNMQYHPHELDGASITPKVPVISVKNRGDQVVTWLAIRVQITNGDGLPISTWTEYLATPFAIENEMPGPLMPNSGERISSVGYCRIHSSEDLHTSVEIVELRVADSPKPAA